MKNKKYITLLIFIVFFRSYGAVQPITPGESLYGIVARIGSETDAIYDTVTEIDSKIDQLAIDINNMSVQDALIPEIDSKMDQLSIDVNNISVQDALIYDAATSIDAKADQLSIDINNISTQDSLIYMTTQGINSQLSSLLVTLTSNNCSTLDGLIYDTVTKIDTKIDTLITEVNNVSQQEILIYNLASVIDSKVDTLKGFPDFVQTPTSFNSAKILADTSRYFFRTANVTTFSVLGETYIMSLKNTGVNNRVVRISALGAFLSLSITPTPFYLAAYKNMTLSGTSFAAVSSSDMQIDTAGSFTAATGTQVYELDTQTVSTASSSAFEYIPKELYSMIIAPGETMTFTVGGIVGVAVSLRFRVLWEEIIN